MSTKSDNAMISLSDSTILVILSKPVCFHQRGVDGKCTRREGGHEPGPGLDYLEYICQKYFEKLISIKTLCPVCCHQRGGN